MDEVKLCPKCDTSKPLNAFCADRRQRDKLSRTCKDCQRVARQEAYRRNPERYVEYNRRYRAGLQREPIEVQQVLDDKRRAANRRYYERNKRRILEYFDQYRETHREYFREYNRNRRANKTNHNAGHTGGD